MADMTDKAAGDLQQAGTQMGRSAATASTRAGIKVGKGAFGLGIGISAGVVYGTVKAILALVDASHQYSAAHGRSNGSSPERQVSLREFTRIAGSKREFMPVQDAQIARQFSRELRKHGVTFAIEKQQDGSRTFHVQGKDAGVVEHALSAAASKIDEQLTKQRSTGEVLEDQGIEAPGERVLEVDEATKNSLAAALNEAAIKEPPVEHRALQPNEGWTRWEPEVKELAATIEQDGRIPLSIANVEILDAALSEHIPKNLDDVKEVVSEERNAFAAADDPEAVQLPHEELGQVETDVSLVLEDAEAQAISKALRGGAGPVDGSAPALDSVNPTGTVFTEYDPASRATAPLGKDIATLSDTLGLPADTEVTVYRGVSEGSQDSLNNGDFVTTNKQLAQDYAGTGTVIEQTVKAGDLLDDRTEPGAEEYIFRQSADPERLALAEETMLRQEVPLTPANVDMLDDAFAEYGWDDLPPEDLAWVQQTLAAEHNRGESMTLEDAIEQPATVRQSDNPYLQMNTPSSQTEEPIVVGAAEAESVSSESLPFSSGEVTEDAPEQAVSHGGTTATPAAAPSAGGKNAKAAQGQAIAQPKAQGNKTAAQTNSASTAKPQREELGKRDETRRKVAERIDTKVQQIKHDHSASPSKLQAPKPERAPRR